MPIPAESEATAATTSPAAATTSPAAATPGAAAATAPAATAAAAPAAAATAPAATAAAAAAANHRIIFVAEAALPSPGSNELLCKPLWLHSDFRVEEQHGATCCSSSPATNCSSSSSNSSSSSSCDPVVSVSAFEDTVVLSTRHSVFVYLRELEAAQREAAANTKQQQQQQQQQRALCSCALPARVCYCVPTEVSVHSVACGWNHILLLSEDHFIYSLGSNEKGQLGDSSSSSSSKFVRAAANYSVFRPTCILAGGDFSVALCEPAAANSSSSSSSNGSSSSSSAEGGDCSS
ncbi:hypothetical protein, conserved, partial [Eimeria tenella]